MASLRKDIQSLVLHPRYLNKLIATFLKTYIVTALAFRPRFTISTPNCSTRPIPAMTQMTSMSSFVMVEEELKMYEKLAKYWADEDGESPNLKASDMEFTVDFPASVPFFTTLKFDSEDDKRCYLTNEVYFLRKLRTVRQLGYFSFSDDLVEDSNDEDADTEEAQIDTRNRTIKATDSKIDLPEMENPPVSTPPATNESPAPLPQKKFSIFRNELLGRLFGRSTSAISV